MKRTPYTKFWSKRRDIRRVSRRRQLKEQAQLSAGGNRVENKNNPCTYRREEIGTWRQEDAKPRRNERRDGVRQEEIYADSSTFDKTVWKGLGRRRPEFSGAARGDRCNAGAQWGW